LLNVLEGKLNMIVTFAVKSSKFEVRGKVRSMPIRNFAKFAGGLQAHD
jgi:hypothetical protein